MIYFMICQLFHRVKCEHQKKIKSFPGADIGSDHELVIMTFRLRLQRVKKQGNIRVRLSMEKLKDPNIA